MPLATRSSWIRSAPVPAHFEEKSYKNFFKPFIRLLFAVIEEAVVLCSLLSDTDSPEKHGGVESSLQMAERDVCLIAGQAASLLNCTVLITGKEDVVSDGKQTQILTGGDSGFDESPVADVCFLHSAHYFCVRTLLHLMRSVPPEHSGVKLPLKQADEQTQKNPALEVFMYIFLMYWKRN